MAQEAHEKELTSDLAFSTTVWALLVATLASPIVFRRLIRASVIEGIQRAMAERDAGQTEVMANDAVLVGAVGKSLAIGDCVDDGVPSPAPLLGHGLL